MLPCKGCAYRRDIAGDAHSRCVFDWMRHDAEGLARLVLDSNVTPRTARWFRFPFNFDPVWGPDACPQRAEQADPEKVAKPNPLDDLLSLLR